MAADRSACIARWREIEKPDSGHYGGDDELMSIGTPDVWLDGHLHRLRPGDAVGFPAGTGLAHSFLNDTENEVRLLVVGEKRKPENRIFYPTHLHRKALHKNWWDEAPERPLGPHDGTTDKRRAEKAKR